jgi:hypothetical protein
VSFGVGRISFSAVSLLFSICCLLGILSIRSYVDRVESGVVKGLRMTVYTKVSAPERQYSNNRDVENAHV